MAPYGAGRGGVRGRLPRCVRVRDGPAGAEARPGRDRKDQATRVPYRRRDLDSRPGTGR
ncbi:predicted protein [Streptomyces sp. SPB78]|nr:predicted protein [Streptomyces sp. SPB78]